jgi:hypothetical protein
MSLSHKVNSAKGTGELMLVYALDLIQCDIPSRVTAKRYPIAPPFPLFDSAIRIAITLVDVGIWGAGLCEPQRSNKYDASRMCGILTVHNWLPR